MLYGRIRAMLNLNSIQGNLRQSLWSKVANFENNTENIMVNQDNEACAFEKNYGKMPSYSKYLQAFGKLELQRTEKESQVNSTTRV